MTDDRKKIREYLRTLLARREREPRFRDDEPLISSGRLPSLAVVEMIFFLEKEFEIDFARRGFDPYALDSVEKISSLVSRSQK